MLAVQRRLARARLRPGAGSTACTARPQSGRCGRSRRRRDSRPTASSGRDAGGARPGAAAARRSGSQIGRRALAEARRWVGTAEDPPGSNRTPFGAWFGLDGVPWCNIFLSYCFAVGAGYTIAAGFHGAGCTARGCAYVPTTEAWLRATGMWLGRVSPLPGDIAIYNWDGGPPDHIGIVESAGGASFAAIEGNADGEVARRERALADVDGFGRVSGKAVVPGAGVDSPSLP